MIETVDIRAKAKYFSDLAIQYTNPAIRRASRRGEILKYWFNHKPKRRRIQKDIWRNVGEHEVVQTAGVVTLATLLDSPNKPINIQLLGYAAMAHDMDKKYQMRGLRNISATVVSGRITVKESGKRKYLFFQRSERHNAHLLRRSDVSEDVIRISAADGHPALPRFIGKRAANITIEEEIMHYCGSITDGTQILSLDERIKNAEKNTAYQEMNEYGRSVKWTNGRTLYEVQLEVGSQIEQRLVNALLVSGKLDAIWYKVLKADPTKLPDFIRAQIQSRFIFPRELIGINDQSPTPDRHRDSIRLSSEAFKVAANLFNEKNKGLAADRYSHLESIADPAHVLTLSNEEMTDSLLKLGQDERHAKAVPAIYMGEMGEELVDAVITREGADIEPVIMLHEFIHRAAEQRGLKGQSEHYHDQCYAVLGYPKNILAELKQQSPEKYYAKLAECKDIIRAFTEGLTQWAALYLAKKTAGFPPVDAEVAYSDEATAVSEWFQYIDPKNGIDEEKRDELLLDLALTGDFTYLKAALPLPDSLRVGDFQFPEDYLVENTLRGIHSSYLLKRYDRILAHFPPEPETTDSI